MARKEFPMSFLEEVTKYWHIDFVIHERLERWVKRDGFIRTAHFAGSHFCNCGCGGDPSLCVYGDIYFPVWDRETGDLRL